MPPSMQNKRRGRKTMRKGGASEPHPRADPSLKNPNAHHWTKATIKKIKATLAKKKK